MTKAARFARNSEPTGVTNRAVLGKCAIV